MAASTLRTGAIVMAVSATLFGSVVVAADQPKSLLGLFNRIPKSPATTQEADKMVDASQKIPAIVAVKADLEAHEAAVATISGAADAKIRARMGGATPEGAAAGIDMARMQTDKAYAKEMEAKMKTMSPQELMAISAAMTQAMGMKGSVAVYDPPDVKAAAEAGQALIDPDQQAARTATYQRRWAEVEKKVAAVNEKFAAKYPAKPAGCDGEGGGTKECTDAWGQYHTAMMPLLYARDAEVLRLEAAAVEEERAAMAEEVRTADQHLLAAQYGAASQELGNPAHILFLDQHIAEEIKVLATKFEDVVTRAAFVTHCGLEYFVDTKGCYGAQ